MLWWRTPLRIMCSIAEHRASASLIQVHSIWSQSSQCEYPVALSFSSPLCTVHVNLLNPFHLHVFYDVIWLAKVGCDRLLHLPGPDVGAVSIHSDVHGVLCLSNVLQATLLALYQVDSFCM